MTPSRALTGKDVVKALTRLGFQVVRSRGSHRFLRHPDGRCTVVPVHKGETLGPGLLAKILRDAEISREELEAKA
jgi:predicted RNA binding protein YcfA (HicA-like mRNA interferase family)